MKALKLLILLLIVAFIIVVGGGAAFIAFSDPNDFKEMIAEKVREETGRTLSLDGDLEWAFWPKIRIKGGPLSLSNAAGFGDEPFLAADEVQIAVATMPLLRNRVEMDTIKLHGVVINLAKHSEGVTNWQDFVGEGEETESEAGGLASIMLGGVDIKDARLTWTDATIDQQVTISKINVSTGELRFGDPIEFSLSLTAVANQPALDGDVSLTGTVSYDLDDEHYVIKPLAFESNLRGKHLPGGSAIIEAGAEIDINLAAETAQITGLKLTGLGTTVDGEFTATDIENEKPSAQGFLNIEGQDLALIFNAFELPVGKQLAGISNRAFNFAAAFDANMDTGEVTVSKLDGNMLGAKLTGGFNASKANTDKPVASGNISANGPDLPTVMAVIGQIQGADAQTLKNLNQALRGSKDKSFTLTADLDADMGEGKASLPKLNAKLLGNTITGEVFATNANSDKPAVKGSLKASGADLPSLIAVAAQFQEDGKALTEMASSLAKEKNKAFNIEASFDTDLKEGRIDLPTLSADLLGLEIRGGMKGKDVDFEKGDGTLDGQFNINGKNLGPLLRSVGQGDLAKSVKTMQVDAGVKGSLSDLQLSPLSFTTSVAGAGVKKPVELKVSAGSARANLDDETLTLTDLTVTGLGLNAKANIDVEKIKTEPSFTGSLDIPAFNLKRLLASLNKPVPKTADPKAMTSLGLKTQFSGTTSSIKLENLKIALDQTNIQGDVTVASFEGPDLAFGIGIDTINADRYLEPAAKGKRRPVTPEAAAAGAASELPLETLRALKIKGDLLIGKLVLSGAKMDNIKFSIRADGGIIKLDPIGAQLYQGSYGGVVTLNAKGKQPRLGLQTNLNKVSVEPLIRDTVGNDMLSGIVSLNAKLNASGGDGDLIKKSLRGSGQFNTSNGVFRGVDAVAVLRAVEQIIECKCPVAVPKGGETRFNTLGGTLNAKNGVIHNQDLYMAGDGFAITGKGMLANLHNNTVKYDLKLSVAEARQEGAGNYNLGGYTVPIQCRGAIESPTCLPDFGNILKQVATSAVTKKIGDKLKDAIGGDAGEALKQIFKF